MSLDKLLESFRSTEVRLFSPEQEPRTPYSPETVDALFHLPLLALAIMVIARRTPFPTVALGRRVATLLVQRFVALQRAPHGLETSITLRRRCADALAFLEAGKLVTVSSDESRIITLTKDGKVHLDRSSRHATDIGLLVRQLRRDQERVVARLGNER